MARPESPAQSQHGTDWRSRLRTVETAAVAGIIFAVCSIVSFRMLLAIPPLSAFDAEILAIYSGPGAGAQSLIALNLFIVAVIGFLWFVALIRNRMGPNEPKLFSTVFFGGGILVAAVMLLAITAFVAPPVVVAVGDPTPDPGAASMRGALGIAVRLGLGPGSRHCSSSP